MPIQSPPWLTNIPELEISLNQYDKQNTNHQLFQQKYLEITKKYTNHQFYYTDASKNDDGVGFAFINNGTTHLFQMPPYYSVFTGEMMAIEKALQHSMQVMGNIAIVTDSLSSIQSLQQIYPNNASAKIKKLFNMIFKYHRDT